MDQADQNQTQKNQATLWDLMNVAMAIENERDCDFFTNFATRAMDAKQIDAEKLAKAKEYAHDRNLWHVSAILGKIK